MLHSTPLGHSARPLIWYDVTLPYVLTSLCRSSRSKFEMHFAQSVLPVTMLDPVD